MTRTRLTCLIVAFSLSGVSAAYAQDTRHVVEPSIPSACVVLHARLTAPHGVLPPAAEGRLDTGRIQQAMDHCAAGHSVELAADGEKEVFLSGPLNLRSGVTLVVDANTVLAASSNPRVYDVTAGSCGILADMHSEGCRPFLMGADIHDSGIMGAGSVDGRGGARIAGTNLTWWQLAHEGKVLDRYQQVPGLIVLSHVQDFTLYQITLRDSPRYHVDVRDSNGFTAWGVKIMTPGTARNTDGIDPISSTNVTIEHCHIHSGDDGVAINARQGKASSHISVLDNDFYAGHGMSIGSGTYGGVNHVLVRNLTIDGALNGIRIKSDPTRGGLVQNVRYENVCIRNATNPIVLTPHYTNFTGTHNPEYRDIFLRDVHILTPGYYIFSGLDPQHVLGVTLDNVFADGVTPSHVLAMDARVVIGPSLGSLVPSGRNVIASRTPGSRPGTPLACSSRFVPFPALPTAPRLAVTVPPVDHTLYVAADGTGDYWSIQRAIDVAPTTGAVISVAPGIYRETLTIAKPHIVLRSAYTDAARTLVVPPKDASATVSVSANDFLAENLTFATASGEAHTASSGASEAIALKVTGRRDVFKNVRVLGRTVSVGGGSNAANTH